MVDNEWLEIHQRFKNEGIDFSSMKPDDRLIHIWRWLVDAEINLKNSRRMYDKLREQQNEELEAMENYLGQVRELSEKRTVDMENENKKLQDQTSHILSALSNIDIDDENCDSVSDKVGRLCSKYIKLSKEVQVLNKLKLNNPRSDDLIAEMISVSTEKEALKREVAELNERLQFLQKSSRELELDNEKLAFKLSEAFAELEEKEIRLGELTTIFAGDSSSGLNTLQCSKVFDSNKSTLSRLDSEPIHQNEKTGALDKKDFTQSCRTESTSPSLILNDMADYKSSSKLSSLMNSCHEMARLEENKKLQSECESMKTRISNLGEKYNNLALKYIQLKAKKKFQLEDIRARLDASLCQIETLQVQLSVQRQRLRAEEIFRKQIESDLRQLQDEKRNVMVRLMNSEMELKENKRELAILQKKIAMLDSTNSDLLAQLLRSKYKEPTIPSANEDDLPFTSV